MNAIYQVEIVEIGSLARDALEDNMMIIFGNMAPNEIVEYCFIHSHGVLIKPITVAHILKIDNEIFPITSIGEVANKNLAELGHITIKFDGALSAEYPGCIHVKGGTPRDVIIGSKLYFQ